MGGNSNIHAVPVKGGVATEKDLEHLLDVAAGDEKVVEQAAANVRAQRDETRLPLTTENSNAMRK